MTGGRHSRMRQLSNVYCDKQLRLCVQNYVYARHRQASQPGRESTLCASRLRLGTTENSLYADSDMHVAGHGEPAASSSNGK